MAVVGAAIILGCGVVLFGFIREEAWLTDDALITFRYVDNFIAGRGLVFNPGDRVEGASSIVHVLLLSLLRLAHVGPRAAAHTIGIVAALTELALLVGLTLRVTRSALAAVLAGGLFATDRMIHVWATGGLETALHAMLVFAAFASLVDSLDDPNRRVVRTSVLHVLVIASRPEGIALYPLYLAFLWLRSSTRARSIARSLNIVVPALATLMLARVLYYGSATPNPYKAKVVGVPDLFFFGKGYVAHFATRLGLFDALHVLPWLGLAGAVGWAATARDEAGTRPSLSPLVIGAAYVAVLVVVVLPIGGDYMCDFRLLVPVTGIVAFLVAVSVAYALSVEHHARTLGVVAALAFFASHLVRQKNAEAVFDDAPAAPMHKKFLTVTLEGAQRQRDAIARFALPSDTVLADKSGILGYGHQLRTVDATGLLSKHIARDFYLRDTFTEQGTRERLPGHARWPRVDAMQREHMELIFPKVDTAPPNDPPVGPKSPRRYREYPFNFVVLPLGGGQFLRFFTALSASELEARAAERNLPLCYWSPARVLRCL